MGGGIHTVGFTHIMGTPFCDFYRIGHISHDRHSGNYAEHRRVVGQQQADYQKQLEEGRNNIEDHKAQQKTDTVGATLNITL